MTNEKLKKLGINIKNYRKSARLSQEKMAELLKKSRNYIGMIERAEVNLPSATLFEIAEILNVKPEKFFENI